MHQEAHGLLPENVTEVTPELLELFLGGGECSELGGAMHLGGKDRDCGVRTILFTDLVGSTDLTNELGDEAAIEHLRVHDGFVREALLACRGREVKHTGDGIMASFVSAASAVRCAIRVQSEFAKHATRPNTRPPKVCIGGAAGELRLKGFEQPVRAHRVRWA